MAKWRCTCRRRAGSRTARRSLYIDAWRRSSIRIAMRRDTNARAALAARCRPVSVARSGAIADHRRVTRGRPSQVDRERQFGQTTDVLEEGGSGRQSGQARMNADKDFKLVFFKGLFSVATMSTKCSRRYPAHARPYATAIQGNGDRFRLYTPILD